MAKKLLDSTSSASEAAQENEYIYGMVTKIDGDDLNFLFSVFGTCDNWQSLPYSSVKSFRNLGGMRCMHDDNIYPYFRLEFKTKAIIDIVDEEE